jgi:adenylate cyclase, class 2
MDREPVGRISTSANLELKARDPDPRRTRLTAAALGATEHELVHQRDTYFRTPHGRLKLREADEWAELIHYHRADQVQAGRSVYHRLPIDDPAQTIEGLSAHFEVGPIVVKRRLVLAKENVRIHLDAVRELGEFVELEAVAPPGTRPEDQLDRINALRRGLAITDDRLIDCSYADLADREYPPA